MSIEKSDDHPDSLSLDQIQVFLAVVDTGSFSAAARKLRRAQSAITYAVQKLEDQFGLEVFDRSTYRPTLTEAGNALLPRARRIAGEVGAFRAQARGMAAGVEAEVSLVVDSMFPMPLFLAAIKDFQAAWPSVSPRVMVENMGAAAERLLSGLSTIGSLSPIRVEMPDLVRKPAVDIRLVPVVSPNHPLAAWKGEIPLEVARDNVQLVLTDRSLMLSGKDFGVISTQTWRLSDLGAKRSMLLAGLGWGSMPEHIIADDLQAGRLVRIDAPGLRKGQALTLDLAYRIDAPIGPATRWLADRLTANYSSPVV
jgi:DNA-binding transcriptional LysR family regulator